MIPTTKRVAPLIAFAVVVASADPAASQSASAFTNPICGLVNFSFCAQGPSPLTVPPPPRSAEVVPPPGDDRQEESRPTKATRIATRKPAAKRVAPGKTKPVPDAAEPGPEPDQ